MNATTDALKETREEFVAQWGALGSHWGINRTMAQIHALLMTVPEPLDTDAVMEELEISRGNAHTNLKELVAWGLVRIVVRKGERLPGDLRGPVLVPRAKQPLGREDRMQELVLPHGEGVSLRKRDHIVGVVRDMLERSHRSAPSTRALRAASRVRLRTPSCRGVRRGRAWSRLPQVRGHTRRGCGLRPRGSEARGGSRKAS